MVVADVDPFAVMNVVGLLAFAIAGALKAADAGLDIFGVAVLGVVTALGGGTTRDVLVDRLPASLAVVGEMSVALVGVGLALVLIHSLHGQVRDHPAFLTSDAIGLSAFAATGALVGVQAGVSPFGIVILATITAVGGGSIADILIGRVPVVLRDDFYATPAVLGGIAFLGARAVGAPAGIPSGLCAALVFTVRMLALRYEWRLPQV
ncbi:trimeric intracellular cation channel family protein [Haloferax sp. MBLA0076]|uniref:Trimeric intracellular cation channel family protein n=1 Tax=Haloferax litoreum TaxID=2666140 RepID=A0A6A8GEQ5_9EURY|nr:MULTISPECIES: trimeric intracellular cation channel family protein [Haloferax]KAB1192178.1 trimeric intracellular cation channel family protein [Haloferax sp. CBA1148]MRX20627.1 trimeric intracellular cation channel family protein [Haloferax litoreum]